jgi:hypothetical protein
MVCALCAPRANRWRKHMFDSVDAVDARLVDGLTGSSRMSVNDWALPAQRRVSGTGACSPLRGLCPIDVKPILRSYHLSDIIAAKRVGG